MQDRAELATAQPPELAHHHAQWAPPCTENGLGGQVLTELVLQVPCRRTEGDSLPIKLEIDGASEVT